jgi:hypothetical protein
VRGDVFINSKMLLMIGFMNFKIKLVYSFRGAHTGKIYVHVFIVLSANTCISIYVYTMFLKKSRHSQIKKGCVKNRKNSAGTNYRRVPCK